MTIASMTGFARLSGKLQTEISDIDWVFEIKSVNGKSLDIKIKLPSAYEDMSFELKKIAAQYLQRGSVSVSLELTRSGSGCGVQINEALLKALLNKALGIYAAYPEQIAKPSAGEILRFSGVVEPAAISPADDELLRQNMREGFAILCQNLQADRQAEGAKIRQALQNILQKIDNATRQVELVANELPSKVKEQLENQMKQWVVLADMSEERLAQEVVFYVTKADIREEVDRLKAHIKTASQLLNSSEAVGRRLVFLCQELNREANTTCSKSTDAALTNLGMELKALIEQFREQVQNIE